jgi:hypothetical protein
VSRPAADSAFETLDDLQSRSADYLLGASFAEEAEGVAESIVAINRLNDRYRQLGEEVAEISGEASKEYSLYIDEMSRRVAADSDQHDEELYEKPDPEEVAEMAEKLAEDHNVELTG